MAKTNKTHKTKRLQRQVPPEMHDELDKLISKYIYENHKDYKPLYEAIKNNSDLTLKKIQYNLRPKGLTPSVAGLRKIAIACDLDYNE